MAASSSTVSGPPSILSPGVKSSRYRAMLGTNFVRSGITSPPVPPGGLSVQRLILRLLMVTAAVATTIPRTAHAQGGDSGSIIGYIYDQAGNPVRGIKVTATSPTQIGGAKNAYTDDEGAFRLRQLIPGTFEVRASGPKLRTLLQK